ncbi:hypothetical protein QJS04_geneDACA006447 [Acorus gramineus]|uniref:Uncharacterized protein n=1 Tax=Acorus gramineus TaxID=55184 RepID=A0AAV9AV45_ACOGR|nr:hypothetical protein QJS04_geneDACA006447 [Acorus gramineus]
MEGESQGEFRETDVSPKSPFDDFGSSSSSEGSEGSFTGQKSVDEIGLLGAKLRVLEEDNRVMKEVLVQSLEERAELISEITWRFGAICRRLNRPKSGNGCRSGSLSVEHLERRNISTGLSQVLHQNSNTLLTRRSMKVNFSAFQ